MHGLLLLAALLQTEPGRANDFSKEVRASATFATVRVLNASRQTEGSGVIVGRKGAAVYVLTAAHLVARGDDLEIHAFAPETYPKADSVYHSVEVVATAGGIRDLALLRLSTADPLPAALPLCPARAVPDETTFPVLSVGCGEGEAPVVSVEKVLAKKLVRRDGKTGYCWEVEGRQKPGNSGGPLVDRKGRLLGILSGTSRGNSYFSHLDEVQTFLRRSGYGWLAGEPDE